jgi:hypothetical protein
MIHRRIPICYNYIMKINDLRYNQSNKKALAVWHSMHNRCNDSRIHERRPKYSGCNVCDEWMTFSIFLEWFNNNYIEGNDLDKDILIRKNKTYSPETCAFVPNHINNLINLRDFKLPIYKHGNRYRYHLGTDSGLKKESFFTMDEAVSAYCVAKEARISEVALRSFLNDEIRSDVYIALKNWKVFNE